MLLIMSKCCLYLRMVIQLNIPDVLIPVLKASLNNNLINTEKEIEQLEKDIKDTFSRLNKAKSYKSDIKDVLHQIDTAKRFTIKPKLSADYNKLWRWSDKIKFVLSLSKEPLTSGDIIGYISIIEPEYKASEINKKTLAQTVSRELAKHKNSIDYKAVGQNKSGRLMYELLK